MARINQLHDLFDCSLCTHLLVDPVTIPCGNTICKIHLQDALLDDLVDENSNHFERTFRCDICHLDHFVPKEGFMINKHIRNALETSLSVLRENCLFEECNRKIIDAQNNLNRLVELVDFPSNFIYEYFEDIKREVDLRRESLKVRIDTYSEDAIQLIEDTKSNYLDSLRETGYGLRNEIEGSEQELNHLRRRFDDFEIDNEIIDSLRVLDSRLVRILGQHERVLRGNYSFEFEDTHIKDIFGCFKRIF